MMLVEETGVPDAAVPVARLREHLRLGTGFGEDGLQDPVLAGFLRAAMATIEARTGKALIARDFVLTRTGWQFADRQPLPVAPVTAVAEVALVDAGGSVTVLPSASYRLVQDTQRPFVLAIGSVLPAAPPGGDIRVRFRAGFGETFGDLPADLQEAVLMLAAHYHEFRHDTGLGQGCMPFGVTALIERFRVLRISGGMAS
jgi:uncharacterized phiE125 gp8 family phage protein